MSHSGFATRARNGAGYAVALLGFAIPVSTALDGVLVGLVLIAWLLAWPTAFITSLDALRRDAPALIALMLFALIFASAAWSAAAAAPAASAATKYLDLALIPMFAWAAGHATTQRRALIAFLAAVALNLAISFGSAMELWQALPGMRTYPSNPVGFRLSVTHNFLVSIAAFVLLLAARELRPHSPRLAACALGLALACIYNVLFLVSGRTGYVVLGALLVYFAASVVRDRRSGFLAALLLTTLFGTAYLGSSSFSVRVQDVAADLSRTDDEQTASAALRIGYYRTTLGIIADHPLTGVGAGGFPAAYEARVRGTTAPATVNPHNDYLMLAAQAGVGAALLLVALYVALWRGAGRAQGPLARDLTRGLVLAFAIGGLFNSLLLDHAEGLLFAWAAGLLIAARATPPRGAPA